ncbi:MAG TPA: ABC transporter ATP-binding protein [Polyangiaceae bacterium]|nr:ABC transporter ATP-binding protein [Polyangiaceae bacterium]
MTRGIVVEGLRVLHRDKTREVEAVRDVDLRVAPGEFVTVLGPSGCGKSTLLGAMAGFVRPSAGAVSVDGVAVRGPSPRLGMVFQQQSLFPWRTVVENVAFGLKMRGVGAKERRAEAREMIALVGLQGFEDAYPAQLSGGMQHRAEIARVLVNRPAALLMDEPFGALDAQTRASMQDLLLGIWARLGTTVVFVTHDIDEAVVLGDRVLMMTGRPGTIGWERRVALARPRSADAASSPEFFDVKRECASRLRASSVGEREPALLPAEVVVVEARA